MSCSVEHKNVTFNKLLLFLAFSVVVATINSPKTKLVLYFEKFDLPYPPSVVVVVVLSKFAF